MATGNFLDNELNISILERLVRFQSKQMKTLESLIRKIKGRKTGERHRASTSKDSGVGNIADYSSTNENDNIAILESYISGSDALMEELKSMVQGIKDNKKCKETRQRRSVIHSPVTRHQTEKSSASGQEPSAVKTDEYQTDESVAVVNSMTSESTSPQTTFQQASDADSQSGRTEKNYDKRSTDDMVEHKAHTGEKPFLCETCGKEFRVSADLTRHVRVHSGEKPFSCKICGKKFKQAIHLTGHERIHSGVKPFSCKICGKQFTVSSELTKHARIHTGEKRFSCTVCGKAFTLLADLTKHARVHTEEKPFSCQICDKKFKQAIHLTNHERIHTGEKPFLCKTCGKGFTRSGDLVRHEVIHTGEKVFSCELCDKTFTRKSSVTVHMRNHHK